MLSQNLSHVFRLRGKNEYLMGTDYATHCFTQKFSFVQFIYTFLSAGDSTGD